MREKKYNSTNSDAGFDQVAWFYDWLAGWVFGSSIKKAQVGLLTHIKPGSKILLIGGGTGWILPFFPDQKLTILYLEASSKMLTKARERHLPQNSNKVVFQLGNESFLRKGEVFDIVFTPFFLDLFEKKRFTEVFFLLDKMLANEGKWLWVDFSINKNHFNKTLIWIMYAFFRILCGIKAKSLPPIEPFFKSMGYKILDENYYYQKFISAKVFLKKPFGLPILRNTKHHYSL